MNPSGPTEVDGFATGPFLAAAYDDAETPTELTLYPPEHPHSTTSWITADLETVVSLDTAE